MKALRVLPNIGGASLSHPPAPAFVLPLLILREEPFQLGFWLCTALWEGVVDARDKIIPNTHKVYESIVCFSRRQKHAQAKARSSEVVVNRGSASLGHL